MLARSLWLKPQKRSTQHRVVVANRRRARRSSVIEREAVFEGPHYERRGGQVLDAKRTTVEQRRVHRQEGVLDAFRHAK